MKAVREHHPRSESIGERYYIFCPACYEEYKGRYPDDSRFWESGALHCMKIGIHTFNGDAEHPTFTPSLLCTYEWGEPPRPFVCHSFIRDGRIQYLGDCTHSMPNQTVDLMDVPEQYLPRTKDTD